LSNLPPPFNLAGSAVFQSFRFLPVSIFPFTFCSISFTFVRQWFVFVSGAMLCTRETTVLRSVSALYFVLYVRTQNPPPGRVIVLIKVFFAMLSFPSPASQSCCLRFFEDQKTFFLFPFSVSIPPCCCPLQVSCF